MRTVWQTGAAVRTMRGMPVRRYSMAKNRKAQRAEKSALAKAAEAAKPPVVEVPPPVEVAAPVETPKQKPAKKRHVRPPRQAPAAKPAPLARGTSFAAKLMSVRVAKSIIETDDMDSQGVPKRIAPRPSATTGTAG